jgi:hypothetical protein
MGIDFKLNPKMVDDTYVAMVTKANPRKADPQQIASLFALPNLTKREGKS